MALFNFFKKSFTSNFNKNQEDEIVATLRLLYLMHSVDDIETLEEEDYIHLKYLNSFGLSEEKISELQNKAFPSKWVKDSISDSEFNAILNKLNDTQKLRIISELVQLIGVDNHVSDKEVDFLFKTSKTLKIEDSIVNSLLEPMKNSLKNAKNALPRDYRWFFSAEFGSLQNLLVRKSRIEKENGKADGLDDIWIVDYSLWFDTIKARTSIHIDHSDISAENRMINGHYEEYHFRMLDYDDEDKTEFIFMRFKAFHFIYNQISKWNTTHYSEEELFKYNNLLFHAKTSFYGAVKFAAMDIKNGFELLEKNNIDFDKELINKENDRNPKEKEIKEEATKLFSKTFLNFMNFFLSDNAKKIINDKKNTKFKAIITNIETLFPSVEKELAKEIIDINDPNYYITFSKEQIDYFNKSISILVMSSKSFEFDEYYHFLLDFHKKTNLSIPELIKEEIDKSQDTSSIDDIESYLNQEDNPNKRLFEWAYDLNQGKFGSNIPEQNINKMIEEEILSIDKLPDVLKGFLDKTDIEFVYLSFVAFIKIDIDYMANILNETEHDKFFKWKDVEQYHAIYTLVFDYINNTYNSKYNA